MKELSIEEKAKRYDEALERTKSWARGEHPECFTEAQKAAEFIFPELAESEDEKIRKEILDCFRTMKHTGCFPSKHKEQYDSWIAWLEKQGEQKPYSWKPTKEQFEVLDYAYNSCPGTEKGNYYEGVLETLIDDLHRLEKQGEQEPVVEMKSPEESLGISSEEYNKIVDACLYDDKVEPKCEFEVGDWITFYGGEPLQIIKVGRDLNGKLNYLLLNTSGHNSYYDKNYVDKNAHLWTINNAKNGNVLVDKYGNVGIYQGDKTEVVWYSCCYCGVNKRFYGEGSHEFPCYPATKEQRDTLEKAMKEAEYTFDFERKELKKIEQNPAENSAKVSESSTEERDMGEYKKGFECGKQRVLKYPEDFGLCKKPTEWNEEDEKIIDSSVDNLTELMHRYGEKYGNVGKCIDWLESLKERVKPQNKWKPSDEQVEALANALSLAKNCGEESAFDLRTLYEQLKKLTE